MKQKTVRISIHALRGEGDNQTFPFQPTFISISIHALRGEGDRGGEKTEAGKNNFNPRPPWGGRPP